MRKSGAGFTLIELLVAITIISVLSTIGFTTYQGIQGRARDSVRKGHLNTLAIALEGYFQKNNSYIPTSTANCTEGNSNTLYNDTDLKNFLANQKVPFDPKDQSKYCYYSGTLSGASFRLFAKLENCSDSDVIPGTSCGQYNFTVTSPDLRASAPGATPIPSPTPSPTPTPTPTPPPYQTPPPPPSWTYSTAFSSTQGTNNLTYLGRNPSTGVYATASWDGSKWFVSGADPNFSITSGGMAPAWNYNSFVRWTAPQNGTITISGFFNRCCGANLLGFSPFTIFYVKKNTTNLWTESVTSSTTLNHSYNLTTTVVTGDTIEFWADANWDSGWDGTSIQFTISY